MLSQFARGLQNGLNPLSEFCSKWNFPVNLKKSKVMVFATEKQTDKQI